jgi:hypothetical protein
MKKTIYGGGTPDSEIKALSQDRTHHLVALKLIEMLHEINYIKFLGKTFIDIGSGPSYMMSLYSFVSGCSKYITVDRQEVLDKIKDFYIAMKNNSTSYLFGQMKFEPIENITGDVIKNICSDYEFEKIIFHSQMFLMHIGDKNQRKEIIKAILQKGKIAMFTEPNWGSLDYKEGVLYDFKITMKEFFEIVGVNGNYGSSLFDEINDVIFDDNLPIVPLKISFTLSDIEVGIKCYKELIQHSQRAILTLTGKFNKPSTNPLVIRLKDIKKRLMVEKPEAKRPIFVSVATKSLFR